MCVCVCRERERERKRAKKREVIFADLHKITYRNATMRERERERESSRTVGRGSRSGRERE